MSGQQPWGSGQDPTQTGAAMPAGPGGNGQPDPDTLRSAARRRWRPGMDLGSAEHLRQVIEEDYEDDLLGRAREEALRREVRQRLDKADYEAAFGTRQIMAWDTMIAQPKPGWVLDGWLTAGFYGLAGPPEAGKSLMVRDWLCSLAAAGTNVLYCPTEGEFDMKERFAAHQSYDAARKHLAVLPEGSALSLASRADVDWLAGQCAGAGVRLIVLDMIYGFGITDDNTVAGIAPVIAGCKRLAGGLGACVLALGHPNLTGERRFRGSSMWRGAFDGEFHMADGRLSCEKHKYADKKKLGWPYAVEYPWLRKVKGIGVLVRHDAQEVMVAEDFRLHPGETDAKRARRLCGPMGLTEGYTRKLVAAYRKVHHP